MDGPTLGEVFTGQEPRSRWEGPGKLMAISFGKKMMTDKLANHNRQNLCFPNTNKQTPLGASHGLRQMPGLATVWRLLGGGESGGDWR